MSNVYTQFSSNYELPSKGAAALLVGMGTVLSYVSLSIMDCSDVEAVMTVASECTTDSFILEEFEKFITEHWDQVEDEAVVAKFEIVKDLISDYGTPLENTVNISSSEGGDVYLVGLLFQHIQKKYNIKGAMSLPWANICDKLIPGQFGGGAVVSTIDEVKHIDLNEWINDAVTDKPSIRDILADVLITVQDGKVRVGTNRPDWLGDVAILEINSIGAAIDQIEVTQLAGDLDVWVSKVMTLDDDVVKLLEELEYKPTIDGTIV